MKTQLHGPDMPGDDRDHGQNHEASVVGEMFGGPHGERAFAEVEKDGEEKSSLAQDPADISRADTAAADFADVLVGEPANKIVPRRETAEDISAQANAAGQVPVRRIQTLNPRHSIRLVDRQTLLTLSTPGQSTLVSGRV